MKKPFKRQKIINRPYCIINLSLAGIILMVFIYSGLFSAEKGNHPVPSFYEKITGEPGPSAGLSRAFSEIVRGDLEAARKHNADSLPIFAFFLIQLIQRILVTLLLYKQMPPARYLLPADLTMVLLLFLFCFKGQFIAMTSILFGG
jgi:hypothetical protein